MIRQNKTETVSFRTDSNISRLIYERSQQCGLSPGNWVRGIVVCEVHRLTQEPNRDQTTLVESLEDIRSALEHLKSNQAKTLFYCLTMIAGHDVDAARELVRAKLME